MAGRSLKHSSVLVHHTDTKIAIDQPWGGRLCRLVVYPREGNLHTVKFFEFIHTVKGYFWHDKTRFISPGFSWNNNSYWWSPPPCDHLVACFNWKPFVLFNMQFEWPVLIYVIPRMSTWSICHFQVHLYYFYVAWYIVNFQNYLYLFLLCYVVVVIGSPSILMDCPLRRTY